jgi:hypothetical protein
VNTADWPVELRERPVCPHRQLPIPFIAEVAPDGHGEFTILDHKQAMRCLEDRLCAMCGGPMGDEVALLGDRVSLDPGGMFIEPPVHEHCGELATGGLCPYLSRERVPRRPVPDDVAILGSAADLATVGRSNRKRPVIMAIARDYQAGWVPSSAGSPILAYRPKDVVRVRRYEYRDNRLAETTPGCCGECAGPAVARQQPRRRTRAQRKGARHG